MTKTELISHWLESADEDAEVMTNLYDKGHYSWALFIAHLVLEKTIKALYVQNIGPDVPFVHNLLKIARDAKISMNDEQEEFLLEVTAYNIRGRYPDYKKEFQRTATKEYTGNKIAQIREARTWLISCINPK